MQEARPWILALFFLSLRSSPRPPLPHILTRPTRSLPPSLLLTLWRCSSAAHDDWLGACTIGELEPSQAHNITVRTGSALSTPLLLAVLVRKPPALLMNVYIVGQLEEEDVLDQCQLAPTLPLASDAVCPRRHCVYVFASLIASLRPRMDEPIALDAALNATLVGSANR